MSEAKRIAAAYEDVLLLQIKLFMHEALTCGDETLRNKELDNKFKHAIQKIKRIRKRYSVTPLNGGELFT